MMPHVSPQPLNAIYPPCGCCRIDLQRVYHDGRKIGMSFMNATWADETPIEPR